MAEILLVNPRRRRKAKKARRRKSHARRVHRRRHSAVLGNPRRRRRRNPRFRRHHAKRRRNPAMLGGGIVGSLTSSVKTGLTGALGALGLDLLWGYGSSYLPASLNTGMVQYLSKALGAVLVGIIGGKVLKGRGSALATGAMTVVLHDALKSTLQTAMPTLPLGAYVSTSPIVAYGAPAVGTGPIGVPRLDYQFATPGMPSASNMGKYVSGYMDGTDGTDW